MTRLASHLLVALVAFELGYAALSRRQPTPPRAAIATPAPAYEPTAEPLPAAPPDDLDVLVRASGMGCDCPLPPPDDVDPRYLAPAVQAWLAGVKARCPELAARDVTLDCEEWPCMLRASATDEEGTRADLPALLTCADPDRPDLIVAGQVLTGERMDVVLSVRPAGAQEYARRDTLRMSSIQGGHR